jgi:hypothetical protein
MNSWIHTTQSVVEENRWGEAYQVAVAPLFDGTLLSVPSLEDPTVCVEFGEDRGSGGRHFPMAWSCFVNCGVNLECVQEHDLKQWKKLWLGSVTW